jgi:hypothetical protein
LSYELGVRQKNSLKNEVHSLDHFLFLNKKRRFKKTETGKMPRFYNLDETIESVLKLKGKGRPVCMITEIENNCEINMKI